MNRYAGIVTAIIVMGMFVFAGISSTSGQVIEAPEKIISVPPMPAGDMQAGNFTKLEISPRYGNFRLQPGESKEMTITIRNREKKTVSIKPDVVIQPYGEYMIEKEWITVTPDSADIGAEDSQKFTVKASIPKDASIGYYSAQIAFTDEVIPVPYPQPFPSYVHSFGLSIDVWAPPKIQIMSPYINDQLEAGKESDYEIKLKNTGDKDIGISPRIGSDMGYMGPYGRVSTLTDDAITITAPKNVPAGAVEVVKIHVKVPADVKGYYNGYIDLGIDDPSVREWEGRVQLSFNIWKQPVDPFVKSFNLKEAAPTTIEISSNFFGMYPWGPWNQGTKTAKEPSFETSLEGADGKAELKVVKTVIKGSVSMGSEIPPWEIESTGIYQEMGTQYIETYSADIPAGEWKLKVLPRNTDRFEYTITIGG
ncbi:hypothetical protein ANME2D_01825 [Candidatus Methanoperedens nitroreducens]|uniref:Alpha-galactosidase NEW3 domain-containing protein n=1 Tax=Candidatus Methanoperedens nitratireducens TaxID=1392998 RepID=A0A062V8S3_9EURY|nr:hypothetical protein [Candidatus Methanoperedens nitroreducens]KCZ71770.1 hypothetical protein ANME2D_01825 [Candidatus Methanoperedens nitroreducens]MDJ1422257.1 hypothetical protein [Candidatus Methanoperedens sp.]